MSESDFTARNLTFSEIQGSKVRGQLMRYRPWQVCGKSCNGQNRNVVYPTCYRHSSHFASKIVRGAFSMNFGCCLHYQQCCLMRLSLNDGGEAGEGMGVKRNKEAGVGYYRDDALALVGYLAGAETAVSVCMVLIWGEMAVTGCTKKFTMTSFIFPDRESWFKFCRILKHSRTIFSDRGRKKHESNFYMEFFSYC